MPYKDNFVVKALESEAALNHLLLPLKYALLCYWFYITNKSGEVCTRRAQILCNNPYHSGLDVQLLQSL